MFTHLQRRGIPVNIVLRFRSFVFDASSVQVYVWILNNDEEFDFAFKTMGVTGVMTDYPTRLKAYLETNQLEHLL